MGKRDNDTEQMSEFRERMELNKIHRKIFCCFPHCFPAYNRRQLKWLKEAGEDLQENGTVNPFSEEEYQELFLDVSFWLCSSLYAHYWEFEDRSLSWEGFLDLIQGRAHVAHVAELTFRIFTFVCWAELDVFECQGNFDRHVKAGKFDYATRKDLVPEGKELPVFFPQERFDGGMQQLMRRLESSLYVKAKTACRSLQWGEFRKALEADPVLTEVLAQRIRWAFSTNMRLLREVWECSLVPIPSLYMMRTNQYK